MTSGDFDGFSFSSSSSSSHNSFASMFEKDPAQIFLEMCKLQGANPTDGTEVHCDICFSRGEDSKGGFVLVEREEGLATITGKYTYACSTCKKTYVDAKEEVRKGLSEKKIYNEYQQKAHRYRIGTNVYLEEAMDENMTFRDNVINFKKRKNDTEWAAHITTTTKSKTEEGNGTTGGGGGSDEQNYFTYKMCGLPDCRTTVQTKRSFPCQKCKLVYYCSKDCLDAHEKEHSPFCIREGDAT